MAAPTVQSVEQIISDLNPAYQGSLDVIGQRRAQLPAMFESQRMGLNAEKVQGFNQINTQANARGMAFSGIPLDEQANYLSTKYLPGLQQLKFQENDQNLALDESLAKINQERRLRAMDTRQTQQASLESYLAEERERAWQQQKFAAEQAMERARLAQQASIAAADRSAQYGSGAPTVAPGDAFKSYIQSKFDANKGKQVSRQQQDAWAREFFVNNGVDPSRQQGLWDVFNDTYKRVADPRKDWTWAR